ncbi:GIY-YIG nuclease family protein [Wenyingzhuangia sp. IMCC45574]
MNRPQTIQIFIPDGSPTSVKIAEITTRMVKAVLIPKNKLDYIATREEAKNVGVYFLFGESDEKVKPIAYIGEAEDCFERLKQHNREKEFWNYAVVLISSKNTFTKSDVRYLEYHAVTKAKEANRYILDNEKKINKPHVTESMEADLLDSFETITILLSTLGFPVYEEISKQEEITQDLFYLNGREVKAEGDLINEGFVVYKGSQVSKTTVPSCHGYLLNLRDKLIANKILIENDMYYEFNENYIFKSPSTAVGVVLGRSSNGWKHWKNKEGKTLDELKRN